MLIIGLGTQLEDQNKLCTHESMLSETSVSARQCFTFETIPVSSLDSTTMFNPAIITNKPLVGLYNMAERNTRNKSKQKRGAGNTFQDFDTSQGYFQQLFK